MVANKHKGRYWIYPILKDVITGVFKILPGGVGVGGVLTQLNFNNTGILKAPVIP